MVKQTIQIFARVKPTKARTGAYELSELDDGSNQLSFFLPKEQSGGLVNNKKENYKFKFEKIFDQNAKQEDVFEHVARPVVDNVVSGYNGTIFAYGQTGSGKTFTITGGAEKYSQRGIIPRTLSYIFEVFEKMPDREFSTHISYLEIYNQSGYDLLDPNHDAAKLEDLPKVTLMEDEAQNIHLKNLSVHPAGNEEDALNLLFLGDTNRMIAETPMNQASTRSHCIFTIHLMSKEVGSATVRKSKLHLVDLAGSERVSKTGVNGVLLTEAKYINVSLHYLEQVIVALSEKSRTHIPYRNSMMTSVLRDSLGGNCMTTMIATCSVEKPNIDESVSTCRFAQRVAMIKNDALLNEEMDPRLMVEKLKKEIALLKDELAIATGGQRTDELTDEEIQRCRAAVEAFLEDKDTDATIDIGADMRKIQLCYRILKEAVLSRPKGAATAPVEEDSGSNHYDKMELKRLQDLLLQRDNEINILVNMLKKEKKKNTESVYHTAVTTQNGHKAPTGRPSSGRHSSTSSRQTVASTIAAASSSASVTSQHQHQRFDQPYLQPDSSSEDLQSSRRPYSSRRNKHHSVSSKQILGDMSIGRQEAFEIFKRDYPENDTIEKNKTHLKHKYLEAKGLGERVNQARAMINKAKNQLEQHRVRKAVTAESGDDFDELERELKLSMEDAKSSYKENFAALKELKSEIEHLQHFLERSKVKLMKDFELWWADQMSNLDTQQQQQMPTDIKAAWRTPPPTGAGPKDTHRPHDQKYPMRAHQVPPLELNNSPTFVKESKSSKHQNTQQSESPDKVPYRSSQSMTNHQPDIQLTGDAEADADIMAFLKARQNALQLAQSRRVT